ncbi:hypothetical protein VULLAG_LOCUS20631 [Vulpes lagopus]
MPKRRQRQRRAERYAAKGTSLCSATAPGPGLGSWAKGSLILYSYQGPRFSLRAQSCIALEASEDVQSAKNTSVWHRAAPGQQGHTTPRRWRTCKHADRELHPPGHKQ